MLLTILAEIKSASKGAVQVRIVDLSWAIICKFVTSAGGVISGGSGTEL